MTRGGTELKLQAKMHVEESIEDEELRTFYAAYEDRHRRIDALSYTNIREDDYGRRLQCLTQRELQSSQKEHKQRNQHQNQQHQKQTWASHKQYAYPHLEKNYQKEEQLAQLHTYDKQRTNQSHFSHQQGQSMTLSSEGSFRMEISSNILPSKGGTEDNSSKEEASSYEQKGQNRFSEEQLKVLVNSWLNLHETCETNQSSVAWKAITEMVNAERGSKKTRNQIKRKISNMKQEYKAVKYRNGRSRKMKKTCKYYDEIDSVLGMKRITATRNNSSDVLLDENKVCDVVGMNDNVSTASTEYSSRNSDIFLKNDARATTLPLRMFPSDTIKSLKTYTENVGLQSVILKLATMENRVLERLDRLEVKNNELLTAVSNYFRN